MANSDSADGRVRRGRFGPEVTRLIERLRRLVAEQRLLPRSASSGQRAAYRREIARMQQRLASAVRRELGEGSP
jgi:hypothetical protein